jgi:hypothetical protein
MQNAIGSKPVGKAIDLSLGNLLTKKTGKESRSLRFMSSHREFIFTYHFSKITIEKEKIPRKDSSSGVLSSWG